jgi:hypothetical protein
MATFCKKQRKAVPLPLPWEIRQRCSDSLALDRDGKTHNGVIRIADSILIAEAFDKESRKAARLSVFNLKDKKWYGNFPWPDKEMSVYFGVAPYKNSLIYFTNREYLLKIGLSDKKIDTIPLEKEPSELVNMVIVEDKIYSLENIYGINIVDIKNTGHQILKRPYKGHYYLEQNSISTPVDRALNLVLSCEIDSGRYELYAVDSGMNVKWARTIRIKDRFIQIRAVAMGDYFLIEYDNQMDLVTKDNGTVEWHTEFKFNVFNMLRLDDEEVILYLSSTNDLSSMSAKDSLSNRGIVKVNIKSRKVDWQINNVGTGGRIGFIAKNVLFEYCDDNEWAKIDISSGKFEFFPFPTDHVRVEVIKSRSTGQGYLFYENMLYW